MLGKLWTLKLKCLNKSLQNIFAHSMSQINWYSETTVIFTCMVTLPSGNTNTSLSINTSTVFDNHFTWVSWLISLIPLEILYEELPRSQ